MEKVKLNSDYTIPIPENLKRKIDKDAEFILTVDNDTIKLKKIKEKSLLDKAAETPDRDQPTSEEIERIIHEIRRVR